MSLFGKKQPKDIIPITIDLCDDYFILNGKQFTIPARVSELIDILGEPRCVADKNKGIKSYKEMVCKNYNLSPEKFSEMDYYWDNLGLIASTHERKTVYCFWVKIDNAKKYSMEMTKYNFPGTLLINNRPWQEVVEEIGGNFLLCGRCENGFHPVELCLRMSMKISEAVKEKWTAVMPFIFLRWYEILFIGGLAVSALFLSRCFMRNLYFCKILVVS